MPYLSLFLSALLAATIVPATSEVVFGGLVLEGYAPLWLWFWATLGNTLGAIINGILGRQIDRFEHRRWFPFSQEQKAKARRRFNRYGKWSLLLAWLPIVGDPLTLIGGVLRVPWLDFILLVALGKGVRYAVVLWMVLETLEMAK